MSIPVRPFLLAVAALTSAAFPMTSATAAWADVPHIILHVVDHPLPDALDLRGAAISPESQLLPCSKDDRKKLQPDLDAVSSLVARAGGMRLRRRDFQPGMPITTPDGLIFSLVATPNGSYAVSIDSMHTQTIADRYIDSCLKMASGSIEKMAHLGLMLPHGNLGTAQYSPAVGFYLYMSS